MKEQLMKKSLSELQEILENDIRTAIQSDPMMFWGNLHDSPLQTSNENDSSL